MSINTSRIKNLVRHKNIFIYNKKIEKLVEKIILLSKNLSLYRKNYIKYVKKKVKEEKLTKENINLLNESNGFLLNYSFSDILRDYEELVDDLLYLCNNSTDIYIEFLYILLINSELFNNFLFICTFTSGDKYDTFLFLIYKNFLILIEYYYYFNNASYFNDLYYKLKTIYGNNKDDIIKLRRKQNKSSLIEKQKNVLLHNVNKKNGIKLYNNDNISFLYNYSSEYSNSSNKEYNRRYTFKKMNKTQLKKDEKKNNEKEYNEYVFDNLNTTNNKISLLMNSEKSTSKSNTNSSIKNPNKYDLHYTEKEQIIKKDELRTNLNSIFSNISDNQSNLINVHKKKYLKRRINSCDVTNDKNSYFHQESFSNGNFNINKYYQLKNMFKTFKKLKYEHLYILLYFSLSILPSLFHIYLTRIMSNKKKYLNFSHYIMYISKEIKFHTLIYLKYKENVSKEKKIHSIKSKEEILVEKKEKNNQIDFIQIFENLRTYHANKEDFSKKEMEENEINSGENSLNIRINRDTYIEDYSDNSYGIKKKKCDFLDESDDDLWQFINNFNIEEKFDKIINVNNSNKYFTSIANKKLRLLHMLQIENDLKKCNFKIMKDKEEKNIVESNLLNFPKNISNIFFNKKRKDVKKNSQNVRNEKLYEKKKKETINYMKVDFTKLLENNLKMENIYIYYKKISKKELVNYVGFQNLIKSVSIICNDKFCSFYMSNIDIKHSIEKNQCTLNIVENTCKINKKKEELDVIDSIHISSLHIDNTLIHNEYLKKKIKRNKLYTYKLFNNQIETLLNSKELIEFIKKQKEAKRKKDNLKKDKKKDAFLYSQYKKNYHLANNEKKKCDDVFKFIENKNDNSNIIESDCQSYQNSDSSDNLTLYNYTKNYYSENTFHLDYFVFFIVNIFYLFLHLHNIYFSSSYLNIFLSFSIKLVYKYSNKFENFKLLNPKNKSYNKHSFDKVDCIEREKDLSRINEDNIDKGKLEISLKQKDTKGRKSFIRFMGRSAFFKISKNCKNEKYENYSSNEKSKYNDIEEEKMKELEELLAKKKKFKNKKKEESKIFFSKKNNDFLPNTFDIIINSFFDLCISLCSIDFKCSNFKKNKFNRMYFCNHIFFYHHLINKRYSYDSMNKFNITNYRNSVESYLFYFDELKNSETFTNQFTQNIYFNNNYKDNINRKNEMKKNICNDHPYMEKFSALDNKKLSSNSSSCLLEEEDIETYIFSKKKKTIKNQKKIIESKEVRRLLPFKSTRTKEKQSKKNNLEDKMNKKVRKLYVDSIFSNIIDKSRHYEKENYLQTDDCSNFTNNTEYSTCSDKSFSFLKKMKKKMKNRIYLDENNLIHILINIGCIYMNNIKYNSGIILKYFYKMNEYDVLSNRENFYNYIAQVFYSKNSFFSHIYNQYFISFFFFFKIHYLFFLIKYKCENEIFLKAYWFLYAVYNITQS